jgi:glycosyltransferase involved in cell wall biosynthesis
MKTVDLVVPCYNEGQVLERFFRETSAAAESISGYDFRFIFVDDGSADDTLKIIQDLAERHPCVRYISFSRNFGKEAGIYAGLKNSRSDLTVVMDADLQHPPALLAPMIQAVEEGYDSCSARRVSREGEPMIRSFFARCFYRLINAMTDVDMVDGAVDYRIMTRQMVEAVLSLSEIQRFSKGIFAWVGFKTKWVEFKNVERLEGESKWSFWKLFKYAVEGITAFTTVPLRFASILGLVASLSSFLLMLYEFIKSVAYGVDVKGYPSTLIMLLLIGGIMIMSSGILGEYVARMYMETKRRPVYIEKMSNINIKEENRGERS